MENDKPYDAFQGLFHEALGKDTRLLTEYHALLVRTGKDYCKPKPLCQVCPLLDMLSFPARGKFLEVTNPFMRENVIE